MSRTPVSSPPIGGLGTRLFLGLFFGVFLAVGGGMFFALVARPIARIVSARGWDAVPCDVISSDLHVNSSSDGNTYRVDVRYRYDAGGEQRIGERYRFSRMNTSGRSGKEATVDRLRAEPRQTCWVNPNDPSDAVLDRGPSADLLFGLIPLLFVVVGGGGVYAAVAGRRTKYMNAIPLPDATTHAAVTFASRERSTPAVLTPLQTRSAKFIGLTLFALFWNGVISVFIYQLAREWRTDAFSVLGTLFLIPFVVVGAVLIVFAATFGMLLANPRPVIRVSEAAIPLGDELKIQWIIEGAVHKLRGLRIELEGREEAQYRRGTDNITDRSTFAKLVVADEAAPVGASGSREVRIPADSMHSLDGKHNKIIWMLRVRGEIPNWPDSDDEFALTVAPRRR